MRQSWIFSLIVAVAMLLMFTGCVREQPRIIVITATFLPPANSITEIPPDAAAVQSTPVPLPVQPDVTLVLSPVPQQPVSNPTPNATRPPVDIPSQHTVQAGETLFGIATRYNVSLDAILQVNELINPNILNVGQVINLPDSPSTYTPNFKIIPDSRLVRAPGSSNFNIAQFIAQQPGHIRVAVDAVTTNLDNGAGLAQTLNATQIVERVSLEYSIDPRILLMLLEFRAGWLSNPQPREDLLTHPLISEEKSAGIDRSGMYRQLAWAANELNRGYYSWKYRGSIAVQFEDGVRALYNPELNPGTIAVQYFLSLAGTPYPRWEAEVGFGGLYTIYYRYFGDPFQNAIEPLVPPTIEQPQLALPFESGVEWRYTGGPHGGWGAGSAWASIDFAPSSERPAGSFCYIAEEWLVAVAPGVIARSGGGVIILDLDGDGDEATGWTINYLHLSGTNSVAAGTRVNTGDRLARPSCAGGFSNATHLHISRRFNGEWMPADCQACLPGIVIPPFAMGGWQVIGIEGQEYQGFMQNGSDEIQAEQGRETTINRISG
jgi:LasA protease